MSAPIAPTTTAVYLLVTERVDAPLLLVPLLPLCEGELPVDDAVPEESVGVADGSGNVEPRALISNSSDWA